MANITHVLCPIDFGPASDAGLERAASFAAAFDAKLTIFHAFEVPPSGYPASAVNLAPIVDAIETEARAEVERAVRRVSPRVSRVFGLVRQGSAWRHVEDFVASSGVDLIVMGTHGRTGLPRALIGSIAEKIVRTSTVPVLTAHASGSDIAAAAAMNLPKKLLVPVDFNACSTDALNYAVSLAKTFGAEVFVLHAFELPALGLPEATILNTADLARHVVDAAQAALEDTVKVRKPSGVPMRAILKQDAPWRSILSTAEEVGADLIVMGTHGRRGLPRAILGSVAEKIVRTAPCPVLTVRGRDTEK